MRKLYTLKQCFIDLGSKFPFKVDWYNVDKKEFLYNIVFTAYENNYWYHEGTILGSNYFSYPSPEYESNDFSFDYKHPKFNKDFEELLK